MTGVLEWMAISSSESINKEGDVVACLSMLESVSVLSSLKVGIIMLNLCK